MVLDVEDPTFVPGGDIRLWAVAAAAGGAIWPSRFLAGLVVGEDEATAHAAADASIADDAMAMGPVDCSDQYAHWWTCAGGHVYYRAGVGVWVTRDPGAGDPPVYRLAARAPGYAEACEIVERADRSAIRARRLDHVEEIRERFVSARPWTPVPSCPGWEMRRAGRRGGAWDLRDQWGNTIPWSHDPRMAVVGHLVEIEMEIVGYACARARAPYHAPVPGARREDGALIGVRTLHVDEDGVLSSPAQGTIWTGPVLSAPEWSDSSVIRGVCGVHACWPASTGALPEGHDAPRANSLAEVIGWGRSVQGTEGWRAEHVMLVRVQVPPELVAAVRARYPEIDVIGSEDASDGKGCAGFCR